MEMQKLGELAQCAEEAAHEFLALYHKTGKKYGYDSQDCKSLAQAYEEVNHIIRHITQIPS